MIFLLAAVMMAPPEAAPRAAILGTWRGTSTCVDRTRHPACKDEVVIYDFREKAGDARAVTLDAKKVVDGEVLPMGELDFAWDADEGAWTCEMKTSRVHALWSFVVKGNEITGTLVDLPGGERVRNVAVRRP